MFELLMTPEESFFCCSFSVLVPGVAVAVTEEK